jgi:hypothetical protein
MSQQDNPQDNQENPALGEAGSWSTLPTTNRPAEGATRVASLHQAEQTWRAGEGATDFLGLEQDSVTGEPAVAAVEPAAVEGGAEVNPTQAWLFHMENNASAAPEAGAPAQTAPEWSAESLLDGQDTTPIAQEESSLHALPPLESVAADAALEVDQAPLPEPVQQPGARRKLQWLVAAGLAATLLGAAGWQVWHGKSKTQTTSDALVWRSGSKPAKPGAKPSTKPTPGQTKPADPTTAVVVKPPVIEPPVPTPNETPVPTEVTPVDVAQTQPTPEIPVVQSSPVPPVASDPTPAALVQTTPPSETPAPADFTPVAFPGTRPEDPTVALATPKGARRPEAAEIAGLWASKEIPLEAIDGDDIVRTPLVGGVRVLLKNGEHLQGRLHAVGQGQISMDVALGRMSIDYSDVGELIPIPEADLSKKPSNGLPDETAGLMYVTAKVPGGNLTGWLVQRAGGKLTLITEQAKKITFEDEGFEPVSKGRARVVGTIGRSTAEAVSPISEPERSTPKVKSGKPSSGAAKPAPVKPAPAKPATTKPKG